MHHSDWALPYASQDYVRLLSRHDMIGSMIRLANPHNNARCESFFKTLKPSKPASACSPIARSGGNACATTSIITTSTGLSKALVAFESQVRDSEPSAQVNEFFRHEKSNPPMAPHRWTEAVFHRRLRPILGLRFRPAIPRRVALLHARLRSASRSPVSNPIRGSCSYNQRTANCPLSLCSIQEVHPTKTRLCPPLS